MLKSLKGVYDFELLTLEFLVPEKYNALSLQNYTKYLMTFLAGSQVSDRCPLGYLFLVRVFFFFLLSDNLFGNSF